MHSGFNGVGEENQPRTGRGFRKRGGTETRGLSWKRKAGFCARGNPGGYKGQKGKAQTVGKVLRGE